MKKSYLKEYQNIEKEFYNIDEDKGIATIDLSLDKPDE
mgnify:CR=1 FL=1